MSAEDDMKTLAEAARIRKDKKRKEAAFELAKKRKADMFAGRGSFSAGLKARRKAIESGNIQGAAKAFRKEVE